MLMHECRCDLNHWYNNIIVIDTATVLCRLANCTPTPQNYHQQSSYNIYPTLIVQVKGKYLVVYKINV